MITYWGSNPITTYDVMSEDTVTTTSGSDVLLDSMSLTTPVAGDYLVIFSTTVECSSPGASVYMGVYAGGDLQIEKSVVPYPTGLTLGGSSLTMSLFLQAYVTVDGSQDVEIMWHRSAGTATSYTRSLQMIRLS